MKDSKRRKVFKSLFFQLMILMSGSSQAKEFTGCKPPYDLPDFLKECDTISDPNCYRIQGHQFSCKMDDHPASCSPENEAMFLGMVGTGNISDPKPGVIGKYFFDQYYDTNVADLEKLFQDFSKMTWGTPAGGINPSDIYFEKIDKLDPYIHEALKIKSSSFDSNFKSKHKELIPKLCDPRQFIYCDSSIDLEEGRDVRKTTSKCNCNELYSIVEKGSKECKGRAGVPCGYQINSFDDDIHTAVQQTFQCMKGTHCEVMKNPELSKFRNGQIWHGFGYSPIVVKYILKKATHICTCNPPYVGNRMHGCIPPRTSK